MAEMHPTIKAHLAWWVKPYLMALVIFASIHGSEIDQTKATEMIRRGLKFSIQG